MSDEQQAAREEILEALESTRDSIDFALALLAIPSDKLADVARTATRDKEAPVVRGARIFIATHSAQAITTLRLELEAQRDSLAAEIAVYRSFLTE